MALLNKCLYQVKQYTWPGQAGGTGTHRPGINLRCAGLSVGAGERHGWGRGQLDRRDRQAGRDGKVGCLTAATTMHCSGACQSVLMAFYITLGHYTLHSAD
jgi:hypothetical protein